MEAGIGFVTTFETLRKVDGSLIIEEFVNNESSFTKAIILRFDGKGEYKICSYRTDQIGERKTKNKIILEKYNGSINFDKELEYNNKSKNKGEGNNE